MSDESEVDQGRRGFLKLASVAAPAAAAAAVTGEKAQAEEAPASGSGLRKTAHVKKYFETARF